MHCGLRGEFPGWTASFGQKPQARGLALWASFGEGREIALIGPAVTVALKAQAFSLGFYLIVPGSLSRTRIPLRWLRAFSRQARGRELGVSLPLRHTKGTFPFTCFMLIFNLLIKQPEWKRQKFEGKASPNHTNHVWLRWRSLHIEKEEMQ